MAKFGPPTLLARRVALVLGLVLVGFGSALAGFAMFKHMNPIQIIAERFVPSPDQVFGKPNLLVLVEGLDYDYTANDEEYSTASRSDVIKAVNVDFLNKGIYVLSVPRDTAVVLPNGNRRKINEAQADGGTKEAQKVIAGFLGVPGFDRYVILRADATKDLINAIGGVDVYVKTSDCLQSNTGCTGGRVDYDDSWGHLHVHLTEGLHHLNGDQAVGYGRFRHDWCSDPCRIMRQDQVITAAMNKLRGDKLNTLLHAGNIMTAVRRDIETNLTQSEILTLGSYAADLTTKDLHFAEVPYTGDIQLADGDDLVPDDGAKAKLVHDMLVAPPTPIPSPSAMALADIAPSSLRVDVENGSGVNGVAHLLAVKLQKAGFTIGEVGNATSSDVVKTEIDEHSKTTWAGAKVRAALPRGLQKAPISSVTTEGSSATAPPSDVTIVLGKDLAPALVGETASPAP